MKIIAGGRGSGKTYELILLAAQDPDALFVAKDHHLARYLRKEYKDIIRPVQIIVRYDLDNPSNFRGMGGHYIKNIYVDDIPSGFDIPDMWMYEYRIKAIAVQSKSSYENEFLPDSYLDSLTEMEKARREEKKSSGVDKTPPRYVTIKTDRSS